LISKYERRKNRTVLITGASSVFGKLTAKLLNVKYRTLKIGEAITINSVQISSAKKRWN